MKKLILSLTLMAFAVAVQAGEAKAPQGQDKEKAACCATKAKLEAQAAEGGCGGCAMAKQAKLNGEKQTAYRPGKQALLSPKHAADARR